MNQGSKITRGHMPNRVRAVTFLFLLSIISQIGFSKLLNEKDRNFVSSDFTSSYHPTAVKIAEGESILSAFYKIEKSNTKNNGYKKLQLNHPPGYPIFIGFIYKTADSLKVERLYFLKGAETIIYSISVVVIFFIFNLFFSYYASVFGAVIWALNPLNLWFSKQPHSEVPFFLFFFLSLLFFFKMHSDKNKLYIVLFALGAGCSIFLRSAAILLPVICLLATFLARKNNKQSGYNLYQKIGIFSLPYLLITPWITFISLEHKTFVPMTTSGQTMIYDSLNYLTKEGEDELVKASDNIKNFIAEIGRDFNLQTENVKKTGVATFVFEHFTREPNTSFKILLLKLIKSSHATFSKRDEKKLFFFNLIFFVLVAYGCFHTPRNVYFALSLLFLLYSITLCIMSFPIVRYMVPAFGLFSIYISISLRRFYLNLSKLTTKI